MKPRQVDARRRRLVCAGDLCAERTRYPVLNRSSISRQSWAQDHEPRLAGEPGRVLEADGCQVRRRGYCSQRAPRIRRVGALHGTVHSHVLGNATLEPASGFLKLSGGCGRASQPACFLNQLRKWASCQRYPQIKEICLPACRILSRAACAARNKSIVICNGESCGS